VIILLREIDDIRLLTRQASACQGLHKCKYVKVETPSCICFKMDQLGEKTSSTDIVHNNYGNQCLRFPRGS
jgi:hypothetical protein